MLMTKIKVVQTIGINFDSPENNFEFVFLENRIMRQYLDPFESIVSINHEGFI